MTRGVLILCLMTAVALSGSASAEGWRYVWPELVPAVQEHTYAAEKSVRIVDGIEIRVGCDDGLEMSDWIKDKFKAYFGVEAKVSSVELEPVDRRNLEEYEIFAKNGTIEIFGATGNAVKLAMNTLRQLAQPIRGTLTVTGWEVPELHVRDWPETAFRGLHLCAFPELSPTTLEHQIRLAAYYKFNRVVLEPWGTFRSEKHPWYGFRNGALTVAECRRLAAVAKDLGVTLIPEFNVFGHASAARSIKGKNAILYHAPEYAPLFEPNGAWNWCLTNPNVEKVQADLIAELYDAFGRPGYFHIGCDEADRPTCATCCAGDYGKIVTDHIAAIVGKVDAMGARPMMWHDMLVLWKDPRWKGFYANGSAASVKLLETLPKTTMICDWYYGQPKDDGKYPTLDYFKSLGFPTITCPWDVPAGIAAQGAYAREHRLDGYLGTVWMYVRNDALKRIFRCGAAACWSAKAAAFTYHDHPSTARDFTEHWRVTGVDTPGGDAYEEQGFASRQIE